MRTQRIGGPEQPSVKYRGFLYYPDEICPIYGNNILNVQIGETAPDVRATLKITDSVPVAPVVIDFYRTGGKSYAQFNLAFFKYLLPQNKDSITIHASVEIGGQAVGNMYFNLIRSRGEFGNKEVYIQPTQLLSGAGIAGFEDVVYMYSRLPQVLEEYPYIYSGDNPVTPISGIENTGVLQAAELGNIFSIGYSDSPKVATYKPQVKRCYPNNAFILQITSRYGTKGVIMGIAADASKGGQTYGRRVTALNEFTNDYQIIPYNGIYAQETSGQKIIKEICCDCAGDAGLVELLRDAQVYNAVSFWDFEGQRWLPCDCIGAELKLADAWAEQFINIQIQSYD